jgi:nucleoside-diphosphate-sugar epimerase
MRVLVTGGAGHVGKATVERLLQKGWEVRALDLPTSVEITGAEYVSCDILNYDSLREHLRGCQAVIHLAAIRSPSTTPGQQVFQVNATGTFNVFEAAAAEGIKRIAQASSINAIGCAYNVTDVSPLYFPIDEAHPSSTSDPYSFSKHTIEEIGAYYWRREGISSVALRFPWVYPRDYPQSDAYRNRVQLARQTLDDLLARPEAEQQTLLADARQRTLEYRAARPMEFHDGKPATWRPPQSADPLWFAYNGDRFNFWVMIDERDAAQSLEKGLTADYEGSHVLFANDHHNWLGYDSEILLRLFYPQVTQRKQPLPGSAALVSIDQARKLIGFEPEFSLHGGQHDENR